MQPPSVSIVDAINRGDITTVVALLQLANDPKVWEECVVSASRRGYVGILQILIERPPGDNEMAQEALNRALCWAAEAAKHSVMRVLVEAMDCRQTDWTEALIGATYSEHSETVLEILRADWMRVVNTSTQVPGDNRLAIFRMLAEYSVSHNIPLEWDTIEHSSTYADFYDDDMEQQDGSNEIGGQLPASHSGPQGPPPFSDGQPNARPEPRAHSEPSLVAAPVDDGEGDETMMDVRFMSTTASAMSNISERTQTARDINIIITSPSQTTLKHQNSPIAQWQRYAGLSHVDGSEGAVVGTGSRSAFAAAGAAVASGLGMQVATEGEGSGSATTTNVRTQGGTTCTYGWEPEERPESTGFGPNASSGWGSATASADPSPQPIGQVQGQGEASRAPAQGHEGWGWGWGFGGESGPASNPTLEGGQPARAGSVGPGSQGWASQGPAQDHTLDHDGATRMDGRTSGPASGGVGMTMYQMLMGDGDSPSAPKDPARRSVVRSADSMQAAVVGLWGDEARQKRRG